MKHRPCQLLYSVLCTFVVTLLSQGVKAQATHDLASSAVRVVQLVEGERSQRMYVDALPSLLRTINTRTSAHMQVEPLIIHSLDDPALLENSLLYINVEDRKNWDLSASEVRGLKNFLERGGFLYLDAGIKSDFLRGKRGGGSHSFADWKVRPLVEEMFKNVFPKKSFTALEQSHPLFSLFRGGLPDSSELPEAIRDFVVNEKWPRGTYSLLGITLNNRLAVVASPIVAMGWGKDESERWITSIAFRVREGSDNLNDRLSVAAYSGERFEAKRADGLTDFVYSQANSRPGWIEEADGQWRLFRYYAGEEINDYAHQFYTQLGINIMMYGLLN